MKKVAGVYKIGDEFFVHWKGQQIGISAYEWDVDVSSASVAPNEIDDLIGILGEIKKHIAANEE